MMRNRFKIVLIIIISMIVVSSISVYATYNYFANDIKYKKENGTEISVEDALNELYSINDIDYDKLNIINGVTQIPVEIGRKYIIVFSVTSYYNSSQNYKPYIISGCNIDKETGIISSRYDVLCKYTNAYIVTATSENIVIKGNLADASWNHIVYYKLNN